MALIYLNIKSIWAHLHFYKLIFFYRVLSKLLDIFNLLDNLKVIFEILEIKVKDLNRFLVERKKKVFH